MAKLYKLSAVGRILILLALCGLSNAQILDVDDFCDFAGYDGICLEASKCTDLQAKMQALTLESYHVGRCGFGVREEIICCPKWPTPVQSPPKLPNVFIDLSKQPEFQHKSPPGGAISDSSILSTTSTPKNFNQNDNNFQKHVQDEEDRIKLLFNGNFGQAGSGNNAREWKGDSAPAVNENNNGFISGTPVPNVQSNQNFNGNPAVNEIERMNAIFGVNPEQMGNDNSQDEKKENSFPVVNENNNGFFISNPVLNIRDNQNLNGNPVIDENERMNVIFGSNREDGNEDGKEERKGIPVPVINGNNGVFSANSVPNVQNNLKLSGNPVIDENDRLNAIFGDNPVQVGSGNSKNEGKVNPLPLVNGNNNGIFKQNLIPNVQDNQNFNGNPVVDENERFKVLFNGNPLPIDDGRVRPSGIIDPDSAENLKAKINAIFGGNREEAGNDNDKEARKRNPVPVINENSGVFSVNPVANVQNNELNGYPVIDENDRLNAIFGNNFEHNRNDESKEETKTNPVPLVNGNNNEFFSANPAPNVQGNEQFIGNPMIDANERVKAIFGDDNLVQVGSDNSKDESKGNTVPLVNGNNNRVFNSNALPNVQDNQNFNGNPVVDENERLNALFNGNPLPVDDERFRPSGVIDPDSAENLKAKINAIFGGNREQIGNASDNEESKGNPVPVINGNNNGIFNQNPISNIQNNQKLSGNPFFDENEKFNALFNGNPSQSGSVSSVGKGKGNSVPVIAENNNGFFIENPMSNIQANQKTNDNPLFDENERFNAIFNGNPIPKENHIGGLNGVISQNPALFGGNSVQLGDTNNSGVLNRKPFPGESKLIYNNAAMDEKGILDEKALINAILNGQLESSPEHFIFNDKPLRGRPANRRRHGSFMENRSTFNNGHFNMRNHRKFEEATHRRNQGVYRGSSRNTRIRFANN